MMPVKMPNASTIPITMKVELKSALKAIACSENRLLLPSVCKK